MTREKKLIRQIEYGDRSALGELIEMYYEDILRYCQWHTTDKVIAEDAAQETFLKAVRYLDANRFRGEFKSFLYKIARNTCIDLLRKRYREDIYLDNLEQELDYVETGFIQAEEDVCLQQVIHKLDTEIQEIMLLRFGQELRTLFRQQSSNAESMQSSMQKTILLAEMELRERQKVKTTGFGTFLLEQMRMIGMRIWSVQIVIVLLVYLLLHFVIGIDLEYVTARKVAFMTGILGILMFSSAIPFLYRAQRYKMLEIEASAKYSMNGGMYLLRKIPFVHFRKWAYGMCIVTCGIFIGVTVSCPAYYEMKFTILAGGIVLLLIGSVIYQCVALFYGTGQMVYE